MFIRVKIVHRGSLILTLIPFSVHWDQQRIMYSNKAVLGKMACLVSFKREMAHSKAQKTNKQKTIMAIKICVLKLQFYIKG